MGADFLERNIKIPRDMGTDLKGSFQSPFVLPEKMVIAGSEIGIFERSEFFRFPCDGHFFRGAAGQHKGCLFFWFVFFGQTKKMNSPLGEIML